MSKAIAKVPALAASLAAAARPRLATFWKYARVEMKPPMPSEFPQVAQGFKNLLHAAKTGKYMQLTVREAWLNTLVTLEIIWWFFLGEIIGRRHLPGYYIPAD